MFGQIQKRSFASFKKVKVSKPVVDVDGDDDFRLVNDEDRAVFSSEPPLRNNLDILCLLIFFSLYIF